MLVPKSIAIAIFYIYSLARRCQSCFICILSHEDAKAALSVFSRTEDAKAALSVIIQGN
ncbi:hypothetical protein [Nostoc sp. NMS9]|uniref:hypothetical protein n=1 Tax=Nostoc sp. NMS9 TaxID=2815393 RepID=UPI0025E96679|nr:hypothetical protein [Nostoc sp. NMS9]